MKNEIEKALEHFEKYDSVLSPFLKNVNFGEWFKPKPENQNELFLALCRIIVGQQLSGKAARSIFEKFKAAFENQGITPKNVLSTTNEELRNTGLSWAKVKYIKDLALNFYDNRIDFESLKNLENEDVINELVKIKGIGRWSAEMFLMFTLHRFDVFSFDDLGLNKGLENLYGVKRTDRKKADLLKAEKIVKKWSPYKTFGAIALWNSLEN